MFKNDVVINKVKSNNVIKNKQIFVKQIYQLNKKTSKSWIFVDYKQDSYNTIWTKANSKQKSYKSNTTSINNKILLIAIEK